MDAPASVVARYQRSEAWISHLTLILGTLAALLVGFFHGWRWGTGLMVGSMLAWLNFRWLRQGVDALTDMIAAQSQAGRRIRKLPVSAYFKATFRYALIALVVYVIFRYLNVPIVSMVFGLCVLGAATVVVSVHEILRPQE
jgi:ATP synthase I chain